MLENSRAQVSVTSHNYQHLLFILVSGVKSVYSIFLHEDGEKVS